MNDELKETIEIVLTLGKNKRKSLTYEQAYVVMKQTFFLSKYKKVAQTQEEKWQAEEEMEGLVQYRAEILRTLPQEILNGEDCRKVCLGYTSEKTYTAIEKYYRENTQPTR